MNIKIIIISLFLTLQAYQEQEMTPREEGIVAFMDHPEDYMSCDRASRDQVREKYLLLLPRWGSLGTPAFIKAMSKHVALFPDFLSFRKFREDKFPSRPSVQVITNKDGSWYSVERFHTEEFEYVQSEHSCLPGLVLLEERTCGAIIAVRREVVYPQILSGEQ